MMNNMINELENVAQNVIQNIRNNNAQGLIINVQNDDNSENTSVDTNLSIPDLIPPDEIPHVPPDYYNIIEDENSPIIQYDNISVLTDTTLLDLYYDLNVLRTTSNVKAIKQTPHQIIFDSGASTCATSDASLIDNIVYGNGVKATPAFGPPVTSQAKGKYGPLGLDIILMPGMTETLISLSELCHGGTSGEPNGVFITSEGLRVFTIASVREPMQLMHDHGVEVVRGFLQNGVYVYKGPDDNYNNGPITNTVQVPTSSTKLPQKSTTPLNPPKKSNQKTTNIPLHLYLAQFKPKSLFDHLHNVTGHPGNEVMVWHSKNSTGAKYTEEDASRQRGVCKGCVYGTMHQTPTDHRRIHRDLPLKPVQPPEIQGELAEPHVEIVEDTFDDVRTVYNDQCEQIHDHMVLHFLCKF